MPVVLAVDSLQCLHEDSHLLVLAKPPGLLCVPGRGPDKQDCLSRRAQAQWADALVVTPDSVNMLSEAAASNVWVVKNGTVMGPPKNNLVLEGIRYGAVEELCRQQGIAFELRPITRAEVLAADELMLSSATKEVLPITTLDGQPVGTGQPGPVYQKLYAAYQRDKDALFNA